MSGEDVIAGDGNATSREITAKSDTRDVDDDRLTVHTDELHRAFVIFTMDVHRKVKRQL